jgi:energy-coupling factor transporter ATP-binding protein EcfA2
MRISNITPKFFGRYRSDAPLELPDSSIVVVYGNNEVGKTTYADMAVTLMSSTYDAPLVKRYGNYKDPMKGSIEIVDGAETLTIQFKSATVPQNSGGPVKRDGLPANALWVRTQAIQSLIIRNIFRVSSHEIINGEVAKEKFDGYGLGDRSGASIRSVLANYEAQSKALNKPISDLIKLIRAQENQLVEANKSTSAYESRLTDLSRLAADIEVTRANDRTERELQSQIAFCEGAQLIITTGEKALSSLEEIKTNKQLIHSQFSDADTRVGQIITEIGDLKIQKRQQELDDLVTEFNEKTKEADTALAAISMTRDGLVANVALTSNESRRSLLGRLVENASSRSTKMKNTRQPEIIGRQSELEATESELRDAYFAWDQFNTNIRAQEYVFSPPAATHSSSSSSKFSFPYWSYGIPFLGCLASLVSNQPVGILISVVFGVLLAFLQFSTSRSTPEPHLDTAVVHDITLVHEAAQRVINAENAKTIAQQKLDSLIRDEKLSVQQIDGLSQAIQSILDDCGLPFPINADVATFTSFFEDLRTAVEACAIETELASQVAIRTDSLERIQQSFTALIQEVQGIYTSLEMVFNSALFINTSAACTTLENLQEEFQRQCILRNQVKDVDELFVGRDDEAEVRPLMKMSPFDRSEILEESENRMADIQVKREDLETKQRNLLDQINEFENVSKMSSLRSEIESLNEQLLDLQLNRFRFTLQEKLLRKFASQRAQDLKPALVKNVQTMVLSVAKDWKNIEFLTDANGKIENIEVRKTDDSVVLDSQLSSGAQSLLYLAMRVAIMQQEATNGLSIPLFCDDPLIYMDDDRTRLALQMLKEASIGHQIVYFTCKKEILNLAKDMEIPVKIIT